MAGMLPGVECARRRRFHQSGGSSSDSPTVAVHGGTRRSSFCLYTSNHENHHAASSSFSSQRSVLNQEYCDEKLGGAAREAKERLDERLGTQRKSESTRNKNKESLRIVDGRRAMAVAELQTEEFGSKRSGSKRFSWGKLNWKSSDQVECVVCLEGFKAGESLVHLPCAHRFHSRCLKPWLESNAHCPCCRMGIFVA